ncbi:hypothetical protein [Marixanthomonas ophiurae]|uniref:Uncharacterized protein n=1 Tax=Marixanthomonas ophiurae TaxID=387659 RepID=A0A3E1QDY8_9FLAO|nr:hypothetical protein [Marixanthomonas ophiurae]MAT90253.1 hypothetical protein [Flavobacteriaceae bacterium]RFN60368.1 hypothetical protein DZ858_10110 [Marixanthomonas ophiurae]|tara:strand:- start:3580 stop:4707 length:1128 start_codon:yes stop_codon:yes gene_type:complete
MIDKKELTRNELYDLVWSKPLTTLAKEYAYSDNGLRKICIKHNIPLPKSGYWSKIKFNKKVKKEKLPKEDESIKIELYIRKEGQESINHPNSERAKIKQEIENSELPIVVPDRLSNPDKLVVEAKEDLKEKVPSTWGTSEGLLSTSSGTINLQVSKSNRSRALRFMDTFIKLVKKRGHSIKVTDETIVVINGENLKIRLREFVKREEINDNGWKRSRYKPTGELSFRIESYPEKIWRDGKKSHIEEKLTSILATLELKAKQSKERRLEQEAWQRNWQKQEEIKKAFQEKKDNELSKFKELLSMATRWHKAEYLRNFIKELDNNDLKLQFQNEVIEDTIQWAKEKADWYDPLIEKEVKLLEDVDRDTLEVKKNKYW